jgi:hypothetical protein
MASFIIAIPSTKAGLSNPDQHPSEKPFSSDAFTPGIESLIEEWMAEIVI